MLIFPTSKPAGGDNRVMPGKLIDIRPRKTSTATSPRNPRRPARSGRRGTDSNSDRPATTVDDWRSALAPVTVADFGMGQALGRGRRNVGAGWRRRRTWTNEEKLAGAANGRQLTQSGPPPQTVYRVARKAGGPMLVTVPLRYAK
jgi:hypothetical protein